MILGLFNKPKPPPLTAFCTRLSEPPPTNLKFAGSIITNNSTNLDNRAIVLSVVIMAAAGNFVGDLQSNKLPMFKELRQLLRDTNLDVITAEAINWIALLMFQLWRNDKKKDPEIYERIGQFTFSRANRLVFGMIESQTGFDFKARTDETTKLYSQSLKDGKLVEAFASVVFRSIGRRSLAAPLKTTAGQPLELVWGTINIVVSIFFSTMPHAFYDTFKNMLRDRPDLFPPGDDDFSIS
jgi:hypothetical protein